MPAFARPVKALLFLVSTGVFLLLFAGIGLPLLAAEKEPHTYTPELEAIQASLQRVEQELASLRQGISNETEQRLRSLENVLIDPTQWPQNQDQGEKLRQDLDHIVQTLPPLAAERILPQLVRLNWGVEALWNLRTHTDAKADQVEEVHGSLKELLDRYPQDYFTELHNALEARLHQLQPQLRQFQLKQLLERAHRALEDKEDVSVIYRSLDEYRGEKDVTALLPKLHMKVLEKIGTERVGNFEKTLKQARSFTDERFQQVAVLTVQDGLIRLIMDLQGEEAAPQAVIGQAKHLLAQCDQELQALASRRQEENAQKIRQYQAWALGQIRQFDGPQGWYYDATLPWVEEELAMFRDAAADEEWLAFQVFPSIKELLQEKVGVDLSPMKGAMLTAAKRKALYKEAQRTIGWKNSIHTEIAYRATRDGMVKFLLPIQPHLLDPPVAQLYQQAFAKGWQKLEGRADQFFVAQQAALVPKKTPEEIAHQVSIMKQNP